MKILNKIKDYDSLIFRELIDSNKQLKFLKLTYPVYTENHVKSLFKFNEPQMEVNMFIERREIMYEKQLLFVPNRNNYISLFRYHGMKIFLIFVIVVLLFTSSSIASDFYQNGSVGIGQAEFIEDVRINNIEFRDQFVLVGGWKTYLVSGRNRQYGNSIGTHIPGRFASEMNNALFKLSNLGYYTVDIALYQGDNASRIGGWVLAGDRNKIKERKEKERKRREKPKIDVWFGEGSSTGGSSSPNQKRQLKNCQENLYTSIYKSDFKTKNTRASINIADEYIYLKWGTIEVNKGEPYSFSVIIIDRSGNSRELNEGKNWVNPGRYKLELNYSGIRTVEATVKYKCE